MGGLRQLQHHLGLLNLVMLARQARTTISSMFVSMVTPPFRRREGRSNLALTHPAGSQGARLTIAETEHVVATLFRNNGCERSDIPSPVVIVEYVEEPAIEHRVELLA